MHAFEAFQEHELVHVYTREYAGAPKFLSEGLAEALSCGAREKALRADSSSADELLAWSGDFFEHYRTSQILVAHLVRTYGLGRFWELNRRVTLDSSAEEVEAVVLDLYQEPLEALLAEARSASSELGCLRTWECAGPRWDGDAVPVEERCGLHEYWSFDVQEPSVVFGNFSLLGSCDGHVPPGPRIPGVPGRGVVLGPGRYFLRWQGGGYPWATAPEKNVRLLPLELGLPQAKEGEEIAEEGAAVEFGSPLVLDLDATYFEPGVGRYLRLRKGWSFDVVGEGYLRAACPAGATVQFCATWPEPSACVDLCTEAVKFADEELLLHIELSEASGPVRVEIYRGE